jgi:cytochrome P450
MLEYNPLSEEMIRDPYPTYTRLRESSPIFWHSQLSSWVLTRYGDCQAVIRDPARFASDWRRAGHEAPPGVSPSLQGLDPPDHGPVQRLFVDALREQDLPGIGRQAAAETATCLARLAGEACFDFNAEVARPITLRAVSRLLGIEPPEVERFAELSDAVERGMDAALIPEALEPAIEARGQLNRLIGSLYAEGARPGLLSQVLRDGTARGVSEQTVWSTARVLLLAGYSSTVSAAANAVLALLNHPEALRQLQDAVRRGDGIETAIDELVRYDSPIQGTSRACVEDTVLGGAEIKRGQSVLVLFGAANRDPAQFQAPDEIVLDRRPNRHIAFGWGIHACTGSLLAKLIVRGIVGSLLEMPALPRLAGPVGRPIRATLRYPNHLPITFRPAPPAWSM